MEIGLNMPGLTQGAIGSTITWLLIIFFVGVGICAGVYWFLQQRTYNKTINVFENVAGLGYQLIFKDRARLISIGDGGEEILYLRKKKVYRTAYGKKMGTNTYWFAVGQDGYWYNILLGDLDAKMGLLDIEPIDRDMRYMHVAIRKNITERYRKTGFMEKYGVMLINGIFLIIMGGMVWLMIDQVGGLIQQSTATQEVIQKALEHSNEILGKIDSVGAGGSGIVAG